MTGCNSIFGSHDVTNGSKDADIRPKDAAPYTMYLVGVNVDTTASADPAQAMPTTTGLATTANVMAGKLGEPVMPVDNVAGDGSFAIPYALAQEVYRIVYTPPDGVPVEIQGRIQSATFAVPTLGRPDAVAAPANARLSEVLPTGYPIQGYYSLHLFTTGTFAVRLGGPVNPLGSGTPWTPNGLLNGITSLSGVLATPQRAKGDRIIVVDGAMADPGTATGFSVGSIDDFTGGLAAPTLTPWRTRADVGVQSLNWKLPSDTSQYAVSNRLTAVAPDASWTNNITGSFIQIPPFIFAGVLPTTKLPNFVEPGRGASTIRNWAARGEGGLGVPLFLPMSQTTSVSGLDMVHVFNGVDAPAFTPAIYMAFSRSKTVQGVTLTAGIQSIATTDATNTAEVPFTAGFASQAITLNGVDILTDTNGVIPIPNAPAQLELVIGIDQRATTDDCVSTVYQLGTNTLVAVHRYLTTPNNVAVNDKILVDRSIFGAGQTYILGISCHHGLPGVTAALDWTKASYPFVQAVTWSLPFAVQ